MLILVLNCIPKQQSLKSNNNKIRTGLQQSATVTVLPAVSFPFQYCYICDLCLTVFYDFSRGVDVAVN